MTDGLTRRKRDVIFVMEVLEFESDVALEARIDETGSLDLKSFASIGALSNNETHDMVGHAESFDRTTQTEYSWFQYNRIISIDHSIDLDLVKVEID